MIQNDITQAVCICQPYVLPTYGCKQMLSPLLQHVGDI